MLQFALLFFLFSCFLYLILIICFKKQYYWASPQNSIWCLSIKYSQPPLLIYTGLWPSLAELERVGILMRHIFNLRFYWPTYIPTLACVIAISNALLTIVTNFAANRYLWIFNLRPVLSSHYLIIKYIPRLLHFCY